MWWKREMCRFFKAGQRTKYTHQPIYISNIGSYHLIDGFISIASTRENNQEEGYLCLNNTALYKLNEHPKQTGGRQD